jgi:hypothetical protein
MNNTSSDPSNTPKLIVAWLFVGIPLLWGFYLTLQNALKLFSGPPA